MKCHVLAITFYYTCKLHVDVPDILNLKYNVYEHVTSALQKVMIEFILHTTDTVHPFPISLPPPSPPLSLSKGCATYMSIHVLELVRWSHYLLTTYNKLGCGTMDTPTDKRGKLLSRSPHTNKDQSLYRLINCERSHSKMTSSLKAGA